MAYKTMHSIKEQSKGQKCGNPKIKKYGKDIDVRTWINENNIDCEIYPTLEKYGSLPKHTHDLPQLVGEMEELDLRSSLDRDILTKEMWNSLPLELRKEFNHDPNKFAEEGIAFIKKKIEDANPKKEITQTGPINSNPSTSTNSNPVNTPNP